MRWWRRGEPAPQDGDRPPASSATVPSGAPDEVSTPPPAPTAAPEDEDVERLGAHVAEADPTRPRRAGGGSSPTRIGAVTERSDRGVFHVEHEDDDPDAPITTDAVPDGSGRGRFHVEHGANGAIEEPLRPPSADPEALAWRWRRGQREPRPPPLPTDEHQAVTVRTVGSPVTEQAPRRAVAPRRRARESAPVRGPGVGSVPRAQLERARLLATGAWQQPPEGAGPWVRVAEELRRP